MDAFTRDYPIQVEIPVAWGEMDALQHVNNAVYFRYFETARLHFFDRLDLMAQLQQRGIAPVLSETRARFRRPVTYPDRLSVGARIATLGEDRFTMTYGVFSHRQQTLATLGEAEVVMVAIDRGRKTVIPDAIRAVLAGQLAEAVV
ncbi:acyl-CoA thioesterase [Ferrimonas balearica]|uniref:acyl-CoA thioesterase n=1 Tax=Ferrimonas balearica TaxID=44012 RepID=UPI001C994D51|nr:thioesterase family protein [Ferrimonas balearica]MBY5992487.1 acyl-CoA thioesterase [Ferrimonas balearica]